MGEKFEADDIDRRIIKHLRKNGRATNQEVGESLSLTATAVSARIRQMEEANVLRVVAVSDFVAHGYHVLIAVEIEVQGRPAADVASELAEIPEILAVHVMVGRFDLDVLLVLHDYTELGDLLLEKIGRVRGMVAVNPAIVTDIVKYKFDVAPVGAKGA